MTPALPLPQRIARDLDKIVHLVGEGDAFASQAEELAAQVATDWSTHASAALQIAGGQAIIGKVVALQADSHSAAWLVPASMSGLRSIRPAGPLDAATVMALADALSRLRPTHSAVAGFTNWLWSAGATGFDVDVQGAMFDRLDAIAPVEGARQEIDGKRGRRAQQAAIAFARRRQQTDVLSEQADQRLGSYFRALSGGQLALDPAGFVSLRTAAESGLFWSGAIAEVVVHNEAMLPLTSAQAAAVWLLRAFAAGPSFDAREAGDVISAYSSSTAADSAAGSGAAGPGTGGDDGSGSDGAATDGGDAGGEQSGADHWLRAVVAGLNDFDLGRATGAGIALDQAAVEQLTIMMRDVSLAFTSGVATGLLERAGNGEAAIAELAAVTAQVGLKQIWTHAQLDGLSEPVARGIAVFLKTADAGADFYADLVLGSPASVAAWILRNAPANVRSRIESRLHHLFRSRDPSENTPLVEAMIATGSQSSIRALAEVFVQHKGEGWVGQIVPELCNAIVANRLGEEYLVPLFRDRDANPKLRLLVLRSLESDHRLLADAVKFRPTDLMEPKDVQARIKAARKLLKGG